MNASQIASERWGMSAPITVEKAMPPSKEELDRDLADFLRSQRVAERQGDTIGAVKATLKHVADWTQLHEKKDDTRHDEMARRFEALEKSHIEERVANRARLDSLESDIRELKPEVRKSAESLHDNTEQDLKNQLAEERDAKVEAKAKWNRVVGVAAKIAMAVVILIATTCVGYGLGKLGIK